MSRLQRRSHAADSSGYMLKPYPAMQTLYLATMSLHSSWALSLLEKSMHSSRAAFSSLQTQQGCSMSRQNCGMGCSTPSTHLRLCGGGGGARGLEVCAEVGGGCGCYARESAGAPWSQWRGKSIPDCIELIVTAWLRENGCKRRRGRRLRNHGGSCHQRQDGPEEARAVAGSCRVVGRAASTKTSCPSTTLFRPPIINNRTIFFTRDPATRQPPPSRSWRTPNFSASRARA